MSFRACIDGHIYESEYARTYPNHLLRLAGFDPAEFELCDLDSGERRCATEVALDLHIPVRPPMRRFSVKPRGEAMAVYRFPDVTEVNAGHLPLSASPKEYLRFSAEAVIESVGIDGFRENLPRLYGQGIDLQQQLLTQMRESGIREEILVGRHVHIDIFVEDTSAAPIVSVTPERKSSLQTLVDAKIYG